MRYVTIRAPTEGIVMKGKGLRNAFLFAFFVLIFTNIASSQGFRGIVPLESTCEDVKRILGVEKCGPSQSIYFLKEHWITVNFTSKDDCKKRKLCFRVPPGRVTSLNVSYHKRIPIAEFEYELKRGEGPFGDIGTIAYENKEKGVAAMTLNGLI